MPSGYYSSNSGIQTQGDCVVPAGGYVWLVSKGAISLRPGFRAQLGSEFGAVIGGYSKLPRTLDHDQDGLPDWWELVHFGSLGQGANQDTDGDGITNINEYAQQTNPTDGLTLVADADHGLEASWEKDSGELVGQTVNLLNGNVIEGRSDLRLPSPHRLGLSLHSTYNSLSSSCGDMGCGWTHTYSVNLTPSYTIGTEAYLRVIDATGRAHYFHEDTPGVFVGAFHIPDPIFLDTDLQ